MFLEEVLAKSRSRSSLLAKYTLQYEKNPKSRVFAPLAEIYRKLGMMDEAYKILKAGIRHHPSYTLGYIVLANCYFDNNNFELAYNTIRPFVAKNLENITLQKLFAQTCENLGYLEEALQTYKYLLLINPKDDDVAKKVKYLEDDLTIVEDIKKEEEPTELTNDEDWVQVDFNSKESKTETDNDEQDANWQMSQRSPLEDFKQEVDTNRIQVDERDLDDNYFHEAYDNEDIVEEKVEKKSPIITHTLVDLYTEQGHFDKAVEVLENILTLHPDDQASQERLEQLKNEQSSDSIEVVESEKENLNVQVSKTSEYEKIKLAYELFEKKITEKMALRQTHEI